MPTMTKQGARQVTETLDRVATLFQTEADTLGIDARIATDFARRCDMLSDRIEKQAGLRTAGDDETGLSVDHGESGFDANSIGDEVPGPLEAIDSDEPWMAGEFTQEKFQMLRSLQEGGDLGPVVDTTGRMASTNLAAAFAKFSSVVRIAGLGKLTDAEIKMAFQKLKAMESELANTQAEIHKLAGQLVQREKQLGDQYEKERKAFGERLPETLKGQGDSIHAMTDLLLRYQKVAALNPPKMETVQSGVLEKAGAQFGDTIRDAIAEMFKVVIEENTGIKKAAAKFEFEVLAPATKLASLQDKQAGLMDIMVGMRNFFGKLFAPLMQLVTMASNTIKGLVDDSEKALSQWERANAEAVKAAKQASGNGHGFNLTK